MEILTIETKALGNRSYLLLSDDGQAAAIDPQRDIDRIESIVTERGVTLTHVFETHLHADYVTGGLELARRTGAVYVVAADEVVSYERTATREGDEFQIGNLLVRAMHTPGHTPHHLSYVVHDAGRPVAVFSGGSMLFGSVGRTDLISAEATDHLTRQQFHSVRRLADELPADTAVHPTHGFGSFCSSSSTSGSDSSTVGRERRDNLALQLDDETAFVKQLLGGLTAYPRYYAQMPPINRAGPAPVDLSPPEPVNPVEIRRRIHVGEWVVDLRTRTAFARGHLAGTINLEANDYFSTYLGWTVPWGTPVTLVGDTAEQVAEAQRQMSRIGIDRPAGAADGGLEVWAAGGDIRSYRYATFAELAEARRAGDAVVLDVRRHDEWSGGHIEDALHVPLQELEGQLDQIPDAELWVHCASGYRAALASSLLDRAGHRVIAIDDAWEEAAKHGLTDSASG